MTLVSLLRSAIDGDNSKNSVEYIGKTAPAARHQELSKSWFVEVELQKHVAFITSYQKLNTMSTKTKIVEKNGAVKPASSSLWSRAFVANSEWTDKEEFLDVVYWMRQFIGIFIGILWGLLPLKGFLGLALFALVNAGIIYFYCINFQNINEEEYGGTWELTKEGFMTSFAGFLVTWIIIYSGLHHI